MTSIIHVKNPFLTDPLGVVFARTAFPIILVMVINGSFATIDAYFLGRYVGAEALTAVTLMFPIFMFVVALSTLVAAGFSSVLARQLGAGDTFEAGRSYVQASLLTTLFCALLVTVFLVFGLNLVAWAANGSAELARHGYTYISLSIYWSPLVFFLSINTDSLRAEGRMAAMALISVLSALLNILFDYIFVAELEMGVAGSAWGSIVAQMLAIAAIFAYRAKVGWSFEVSRHSFTPSPQLWRTFLALGAPASLGYIGFALSAGITILLLQIWSVDYQAIAGAYGISTRVMTFVFMPILGLSFATQTIVGNNFGAGKPERSRAALRVAMICAGVYCAGFQACLYLFRSEIGEIFVTDAATVHEFARILPFATLTLFLFGPQMMVGMYFQAIGDARRAALLNLSRTYIFGIPLLVLMPSLVGEIGIWISGAVAEVFVLLLTLVVLKRTGVLKGSNTMKFA
ncbi:MATE family efflux transporter [Falsihalocynthiibacter sp. BN13B15]|uniref:MATE family efflux transporter n=1 Tax=Falsihalocynthiibacter sp. BN13B15 TaxID=3240871 RepID=UPI00350EEB56